MKCFNYYGRLVHDHQDARQSFDSMSIMGTTKTLSVCVLGWSGDQSVEP